MAALLLPAVPASAKVRHVWVGAVPASFDIMPSGKDPLARQDVPDGGHGTHGAQPGQRVFPTIVYRRFTRGWRRPVRNNPRSSTDHDQIPGPLIRARVGDRILVHFKNMDTLYRRGHSMHFHGVHYKPSSDGAFLPGFSGPDGDVRPGRSWTYRLRAGRDSVGVWPYHDHSTSMHESILGGMFGMLSIFGKKERLPDREFVVVFAPSMRSGLQTINGRSFLGNTPVFKSRYGELVQWDVMAMGSEHHTFHPHGHRWRRGDGRPEDTRTVGPAESFRVQWRERHPGTWFYHCHVEDHMDRGMIGIYRVGRRRR
jgi:FtsP/CotA-like multicopper oxidase with cupredoxin domain